MRGALSLLTVLVATQAGAQAPPYPYSIKGIGMEEPDVPFMNQAIGNAAGGMVTNLSWYQSQGGDNTVAPTPQSSCTGLHQELFDGYCFTYDPNKDTLIKAHSDQGVKVTLVLSQTPKWAGSAAQPCPKGPGYEWQCGTASGFATAFGRFAAWGAWHYNGSNNKGLVQRFVIQNEINNPWWYYSDGCGTGGSYPACTLAGLVNRYALDFKEAYDRIKGRPANRDYSGQPAVTGQQPTATIMVGLGGDISAPDNFNPLVGPPYPGITSQSILTALEAQMNGRQWSVAAHAYPDPAQGGTVFGPDDQDLTLGTIGKLEGWLRYAFPTKPWTWEVHLTEQGIAAPLDANGNPIPGNEAAQAAWLCVAYRNVLGTPGVESFMYTPFLTHAGFTSHPELVTCTLNGINCDPNTLGFRQAWATWALANRIDVGQTSCGFEYVPYVKLSRYYHSSRGHFATTRQPPSPASYEASWKLLRSSQSGTHMIYECNALNGGTGWAGPHTFVDTQASCGLPATGFTPMGPLGFAWDAPGTVNGVALVPLNRCFLNIPGWYEHFVSSDANCEGWVKETTLGYVLPG